MDVLEAKQLYDLAKKNASQGILVEIGSAWGGSACLLSQASKEASGNKVYCVDPWSDSAKDIETYWNKESLGDGKPFTSNSFYGKFLANVRENGAPEQIEPIRGKSVEAAKKWSQPIQLLFIDGDHAYEAVKADIEAWEPFLAKGGTIAFHDYDLSVFSVFGVVQAVDELIVASNRFSKLKRLQSLVWATKRG